MQLRDFRGVMIRSRHTKQTALSLHRVAVSHLLLQEKGKNHSPQPLFRHLAHTRGMTGLKGTLECHHQSMTLYVNPSDISEPTMIFENCQGNENQSDDVMELSFNLDNEIESLGGHS